MAVRRRQIAAEQHARLRTAQDLSWDTCRRASRPCRAMPETVVPKWQRRPEAVAERRHSTFLFQREDRGRRAVAAVTAQVIVLVRQDAAAACNRESGAVAHHGGAAEQHEGGWSLRNNPGVAVEGRRDAIDCHAHNRMARRRQRNDAALIAGDEAVAHLHDDGPVERVPSPNRPNTRFFSTRTPSIVARAEPAAVAW